MRRVETLSDGVIAIAITLLVIQLPFDQVGHGELAGALGDHWADFAAYALSFLGIGFVWLNHHALFVTLARVDRAIVLLNLLELFTVAFLPFPTSLVGDYLPDGGANARLAMLLYSGTWFVATGAAAAMSWHALRGRGLLAEGVSRVGARRLSRNLGGATVAYAAFTAVALASPVATIGCYGVAALYFLWRGDVRALSR